MKNIFSLFIIFVIIYSIFVVIPNAFENWQYSDCVESSIKNQEASSYNYAGNTQNDSSDLRTCTDATGKENGEVSNIFWPRFLKI